MDAAQQFLAAAKARAVRSRAAAPDVHPAPSMPQKSAKVRPSNTVSGEGLLPLYHSTMHDEQSSKYGSCWRGGVHREYYDRCPAILQLAVTPSKLKKSTQVNLIHFDVCRLACFFFEKAHDGMS